MLTRLGTGRGSLAVLAISMLSLACGSPRAGAAGLTGPLYPVPGGPGDGHGGNVCFSSGSTLGSPNGVTWTFGGGRATSARACNSPTPPGPFDTERFESLYWGLDPRSRPQIAMDGDYAQTDETLGYQPLLSNLADGRLVWTGLTRMPAACLGEGCTDFHEVSVVTRLELSVTTAGAAATPVRLVPQEQAGIGDAQVGGVVSVTPALVNYRANMKALARLPSETDAQLRAAQTLYDSYRHESPDQQLLTSFTGAFWYVNRPPIAEFTISDLQADVPLSFNADFHDPDGTVKEIGWDFNDDGQFTESDRPAYQWAFPAGGHTVSFRAVDNEAASTVVGKAFVTERRDRDGDGFYPPADCDDTSGAIHPNAVDVPENRVDENCDRVDATWRTMAVTLAWNAKVGRRSTTFLYIRVKGVPGGSTVTVTCKGRRCPRRLTLSPRKRTVALRRYRGRRLPVGAVVTVRVAHTGYKSMVKALTVRPRKAPRLATTCLRPGTNTRITCRDGRAA